MCFGRSRTNKEAYVENEQAPRPVENISKPEPKPVSKVNPEVKSVLPTAVQCTPSQTKAQTRSQSPKDAANPGPITSECKAKPTNRGATSTNPLFIDYVPRSNVGDRKPSIATVMEEGEGDSSEDSNYSHRTPYSRSYLGGGYSRYSPTAHGSYRGVARSSSSGGVDTSYSAATTSYSTSTSNNCYDTTYSGATSSFVSCSYDSYS